MTRIYCPSCKEITDCNLLRERPGWINTAGPGQYSSYSVSDNRRYTTHHRKRFRICTVCEEFIATMEIADSFFIPIVRELTRLQDDEEQRRISARTNARARRKRRRALARARSKQGLTRFGRSSKGESPREREFEPLPPFLTADTGVMFDLLKELVAAGGFDDKGSTGGSNGA